MTTSKQLAAIREALEDYEEGEAIDPVLKKAGLAPASQKMSHDQVVQWLLQERDKADKANIVAQFLHGVETNQAHLRAGLSSLASATHFMQHPFSVDKQLNCQVCGAFEHLDIDFVLLNQTRYLCGSVLSGDIAEMAFFLQQANAIDSPRPEALPLTTRIFEMIRALPDSARPKDMLKQLRKLKGVKMSEEEARSFIDLLGHCAILQTPEHPGLLQRFTNQGLASSSSRSSDWSYPVDFWTGANGVDADAMKYWFGDYPQLLAQ
ncbi:hypothetical protein EGT09_20050 [Pseudomonas putida]|uniref:hypothetical protein n=1 Tax=Pseudomonas putida TaxID=303 RepID=UPI000F795F81|nr:hypothetical protein [Pseudomonas putida]RSC28596.1 hypothetical protein EGT09_20050 [Pseudomonas putida]